MFLIEFFTFISGQTWRVRPSGGFVDSSSYTFNLNLCSRCRGIKGSWRRVDHGSGTSTVQVQLSPNTSSFSRRRRLHQANKTLTFTLVFWSVSGLRGTRETELFERIKVWKHNLRKSWRVGIHLKSSFLSESLFRWKVIKFTLKEFRKQEHKLTH